MGNKLTSCCCCDGDSNKASPLESVDSKASLMSMEEKEKMFTQAINYKDFTIIKLLGKGSFGKVILVKKKDENKLYAMKILKKQLIKMQNHVTHTKAEREILSQLDHPFLVNLQFAFQTPEKLYLVTEFMQGGELFYHLRKERFFSVSRAKFYAAEILLALEYLHSRNTIYRDLKPENVLIGMDGHIKLTDFGLSKVLLGEKDSHRTYTLCGTPEYLAPEILKDAGYDRAVDWWSFGVLLYVMLTGSSPYRASRGSRNKLDYKFYTREINFPGYLESQSVDLIKKLIRVKASERLGSKGAGEIKKHPFFAEVDFNKMLKKKVRAPFKPFARDEFDLSNFDRGFTEEEIQTSDFEMDKDALYAEKYENFTYVKEEIAQ